MVFPRGGEIFSLYLGFRKKTGPMYMGHYHIFVFYSKANAPYFLGVGVSIDRCIISSSGLGHAYLMEQIPHFLLQRAVLWPNEFLNESFVINIRKFVCIHSRT